MVEVGQHWYVFGDHFTVEKTGLRDRDGLEAVLLRPHNRKQKPVLDLVAVERLKRKGQQLS